MAPRKSEHPAVTSAEEPDVGNLDLPVDESMPLSFFHDPDGAPFSERQQFDLSQAFQALSNPITRHFVELLAIEPFSTVDLARHFDLTQNQVDTAGSLLIKAGFAKPIDGGEVRGRCYQLDHRALDLIRSWLGRIATEAPVLEKHG